MNYCRKIGLKPILFVFAFICVLILLVVLNWILLPGIQSPTDGGNFVRESEDKIILLWDKFADLNLREGNGIFRQFKCPEFRCSLTYERSKNAIANAIMFHMRETIHPQQLPPRLSHRQRWIFVMKEPPIYSHFDPNFFNNVFNWTMTYKTASDIPWPYGVVYSRPNILKQIPDYHKLKTNSRKVAWIVSRCKSDSRREQFVQKLSAHISVDIYGKCGSASCTRFGNGSCDEIIKDYHFYLAFENSLCPDYATEKLFKVLARKELPAIPIVFGGSDYSKLAPPESVIDAGNFSGGIKALAVFLEQVINDRDLYNRYHEWRRRHLVSAWGTPVSVCQLCAKLHNEELATAKSYSGYELSAFWNKSSCKKQNFY